MAREHGFVALPAAEVPMVEVEVVRQMRELAAQHWGAKRIARLLGVARNTVRRYLRGGPEAEVQVRLQARALAPQVRDEAQRLYRGPAGGNAVVAARLLAAQGVVASVRTVQREVAVLRRELRVQQVATVRYETAPGEQLQIDFGQKLVRIASEWVKVHLLVAVLSFSRRCFVKAFLSERQDDWREGIAAAFLHFGGVTRFVLGDNAKALVVDRDRATRTVIFHPAYLAFCRDWGVIPRACQPYRARTKGKTESGVKYVKRNALAGLEFDSFAGLTGHLTEWMRLADERVHGTTHERPLDRFLRAELAALQPLPAQPLPSRERRLQRRVANDALVDIDTVRYSVPHRLVRDRVEVLVGEHEVRIFHGPALVATHRRSTEPHTRVIDPAHYAGLWRPWAEAEAPAVAPAPADALGRSLSVYAALVEGAGGAP